MSEVRVAGATGEPDLTAAIPDVGAAGGPGPLPGGAPSSPPVSGPPATPAGMDPLFVEALVKLPFVVLANRRVQLPLIGPIGGKDLWYLHDREAETLGIPAKVYIDRALMSSGVSGTLAGLLIASAMVIAPRIVADVLDQAEQLRRAQQHTAPPVYSPAQPPPTSPAPAASAVAAATPVPTWAPPAPSVPGPETKTIELEGGEKVTVRVHQDPDMPTREGWFK